MSGSHINPIVTVAAATLGNIPLIQVPIYFLGQMAGAVVGFGLLKVSPRNCNSITITRGAKWISDIQQRFGN